MKLLRSKSSEVFPEFRLWCRTSCNHRPEACGVFCCFSHNVSLMLILTVLERGPHIMQIVASTLVGGSIRENEDSKCFEKNWSWETVFW